MDHEFLYPLATDRDGVRQVYVARYTSANGAGSSCVFSRLDPAIFFVVSGLGSDVDWTTFPDADRETQHEEHDGSEEATPIFRVERLGPFGIRILGIVTRMSVADSWYVDGDLAESAKQNFSAATGRDSVELLRTEQQVGARI